MKKINSFFLRFSFSAIAFTLAIWLLNQRLDYSLINQFISTFHITATSILLSIAILLLWALNILIEAKKWNFLQKKLSPTPLIFSLRGVFAGIAVSLFLPNRSGEFVGKALMGNKKLFAQSSALAIAGSLTQLFATIAIGSPILIFQLSQGDMFFSNTWVLLLMSIVFSIILLLLLFSYKLKSLSGIFKRRKQWKLAFEALSLLSLKDNLILIGLSVTRYLVFSFQTILVFWCFGFPETMDVIFQIIAISYLLMVFLPIITIAEIPVKVGVLVFSLSLVLHDRAFIPNSYAVIAGLASTFIWLINVFFAGIVGIIFLSLPKRNSTHEYH